MAHINQYLKADLGDCEIVNITATGTIAAGAFLRTGTLDGIVGKSAVSGEKSFVLATVPSPGISVPKATGVALAVGAKVYYSDSNGNVSATNTDVFVGKVLEAAASGDTRVVISLHNYAA